MSVSFGYALSHDMKTTKDSLRLLTTATLIRRFHEQCPLDELHDKAVRSYETLLEARGKKQTATEIGALLDLPEMIIRQYADAIISQLLFNRENDPYLSFGLRNSASIFEVSRRWKTLIVLYHPDRHTDQGIIERKLKKANEAYDRIQRMQGQKTHHSPFRALNVRDVKRRASLPRYRHSRPLSLVVCSVAVIIAALSILFLIWSI